jgi:REP element-mobilizing transposase RayT
MPRQPRLDAPGILHHVMVRGIERRAIVRDDTDRADFVDRVAGVAAQGTWAVYAWALLANHAHLLVRTGTRPLSRSMRSLLTGYAEAFNRRHARHGHLFQNRDKSIVVEEDPYLLELVRYLHLNPLRAQGVPDLSTLDRYPWTGHSALLGRVPRPWQATITVLAQFGATRRQARRAYRAFVAAGIPQGRRPELQGGGLVRSRGEWVAAPALRHGREGYGGDERILGSGAFVEETRTALAAATAIPRRRVPLMRVLAAVAAATGVSVDTLTGPGRGRRVTRARAGAAYLWCRLAGESGRALATALGVSHQAVSAAATRGEALAAEWHVVWHTLQ